MKNKRSNAQINSIIRNDKARPKKTKEDIQKKMIYKKRLEARIDQNTDNLTARFPNKKSKQKKY